MKARDEEHCAKQLLLRAREIHWIDDLELGKVRISRTNERQTHKFVEATDEDVPIF